MKKIILILSFVFFFTGLNADCPHCYRAVRARLIMLNGETTDGYLFLPPRGNYILTVMGKTETRKEGKDIKKMIVKDDKSGNPAESITFIDDITFVGGMFFCTAEDIREVRMKDIDKIIYISYDGKVGGAGSIPLLGKEKADKIRKLAKINSITIAGDLGDHLIVSLDDNGDKILGNIEELRGLNCVLSREHYIYRDLANLRIGKFSIMDARIIARRCIRENLFTEFFSVVDKKCTMALEFVKFSNDYMQTGNPQSMIDYITKLPCDEEDKNRAIYLLKDSSAIEDDRSSGKAGPYRTQANINLQKIIEAHKILQIHARTDLSGIGEDIVKCSEKDRDIAAFAWGWD